MRSKVISRWSAAALLAAALGTAQSDVQFRCGRIAGHTEDSLILETRPGEHIEFALDEESETPAPLVVGARVQVEFRDQGSRDPLALYVLPIRADLDDCPQRLSPITTHGCTLP